MTFFFIFLSEISLTFFIVIILPFRSGLGLGLLSATQTTTQADDPDHADSKPRGRIVVCFRCVKWWWKETGIIRFFSLKDLELNHIHGYRGFDCRDNLFYLADNESIVYPAAGAGVIHLIRKGFFNGSKWIFEEVKERCISFSIFTFKELNDSIWVIRMILYQWLFITMKNMGISLHQDKLVKIQRFMFGILKHSKRFRFSQVDINEVNQINFFFFFISPQTFRRRCLFVEFFSQRKIIIISRCWCAFYNCRLALGRRFSLNRIRNSKCFLSSVRCQCCVYGCIRRTSFSCIVSSEFGYTICFCWCQTFEILVTGWKYFGW